MENGKFVFQGFTFDNEKSVLEAKKEAEAIEYLKAKTDLSNPEMMLRLYNKLLDRNTMETEVGIAFLMELREKIIDSGVIADNLLRPVPEVRRETGKFVKKEKQRSLSRIAKVERENTGLKIAVMFMTGVIIAMFVIVLTGKRSPLAIKYEEELINKYSYWSEQLGAKEDQLRNIVNGLKEMGIEVSMDELANGDSGSEK